MRCFGNDENDDSVKLLEQTKAHALRNKVVAFPSVAAWCVVIPMEKPEAGKRVTWRAITDACSSEVGKWGIR